jgi:Zn finger protein HypA/HybF involved in hydrogenase expression
MAYDKKALIETKLRRMSGMSPEKRIAMNTASETMSAWVRCWNCKTIVEAPRNELKMCPKCQKNLWSRDE